MSKKETKKSVPSNEYEPRRRIIVTQLSYVPGRNRSENPFPSQTIPNMVDSLANLFDRIAAGREVNTGLSPVYHSDLNVPEEFQYDPKLDKVESYDRARKMASLIDSHNDKVDRLNKEEAKRQSDAIAAENASLKEQLAKLSLPPDQTPRV
jgi:hypothetical protein